MSLSSPVDRNSQHALTKHVRYKHARQAVVALITITALSSCERFKERVLGMEKPLASSQQTLAADSVSMARDSITRRIKAARDSVAALNAVRFATDSLTHGKRPGTTTATTANSKTSATVTPAPQPLTRAQVLGDSIANAQAEKLAGQNRSGLAGDSVRGVVQMDGSGPGSRPILLANAGKTLITLSGMGTEGLSQVLGFDVVVRGMRISPRDIVVSGFSVRGTNGIPTIDGRLRRSGNGWVVELSDKSGSRPLPSVPQALQAFEGARVWVAEEAKNAAPQLYGVITRR